MVAKMCISENNGGYCPTVVEQSGGNSNSNIKAIAAVALVILRLIGCDKKMTPFAATCRDIVKAVLLVSNLTCTHIRSQSSAQIYTYTNGQRDMSDVLFRDHASAFLRASMSTCTTNGTLEHLLSSHTNDTSRGRWAQSAPLQRHAAERVQPDTTYARLLA